VEERREMDALKFYVKIGEEGKIELPELREFRGRRAEIVILPPKEEDIEDILMASDPIPYSDLKSKKRRPVIVISNNLYNQKTEDIVVVAVTSNIETKEYTLLITQNDMEEGNLPRDSMIRVDKIYSLSQLIVVKRLGKIKEATFESLIALLNRLMASAE
jgi:mRNA interferase MazF